MPNTFFAFFRAIAEIPSPSRTGARAAAQDSAMTTTGWLREASKLKKSENNMAVNCQRGKDRNDERRNPKPGMVFNFRERWMAVIVHLSLLKFEVLVKFMTVW